MFSKRTRLFSNFKIINILHIFQSLISKKKNFIDVLKKFLKKGYKIERGIRITDDFKGWFDVKKTNLKNSLIF